MFRPARQFLVLAALIMAAVTLVLPHQARAQDARIEMDIFKAGFIVGVSGGSGLLTFQGKGYPLSIGGVSLGATIGASRAELIGEVYNLGKPSDIEGTYVAVQAGVAAAGGAKVFELSNSKGVNLQLRGAQIGFELSLDLSGMQIKLK
jgi:hypothetical protein